MPGTFNPVSGNPVAGVPHAKSFRTLLGFGSNNGGGSSIKPSFFSQLNLKAGRKSFGGPADCQNDHSVLVIDSKLDEGGTCPAGNRVVLNDETDLSRSGQMSMKPYSSSPSKASSRHNISRSLPTTPVDTQATSYSLNSHTDLDMSFVKGATSEARVDPNNSSLSKAFPDLSAELSLLIDERLPLDTGSQSDHHPDSQVMIMNTGSSEFALPQRVVTMPPFLDLSPTELDQTQRGGFAAIVAPPQVPRGVHGPSGSTTRRTPEGAMENTTASFDLSSARLSLDLMRQSLDEDWARSVLIENSSVPSADTSALLPPDASLKVSGSGIIDSTPFLSPCASTSLSQHKERDVSFDLDTLDPDLVALLRPNSANQDRSQITRVVTPSPLEPFAPPPDPLNPVRTMKQPGITSTPSASPSPSTGYTKQESSMPSPIRKFATISASSSPARQLRLPRSYTAQDIFPPSKSPKPSLAVSANVDMTWQDVRARDDGRPSPASATTFSENGARSDISKQPSPLSAIPLTLDDLQRNPGTESSARPNSTLNITTRRKGRVAIPGPVQSTSPVSVLAPSVDSRPAAHYVPGSRDPDFRPASASPEIHASYSHVFGSTGRERERARPSMDGLFSKPPSPERCAGRPGSADTGRPPAPFHARLNSHGLSHSQDRDWDLLAERRYRKRSMSLDQSSSGVERRADDFHSKGINSRYGGQGDHERLADSVGRGGAEYAHGMVSGLGTPYDTRDPDRDQDRYGYGYGHSDRERLVRPQTEWLGPRTVKAFAAAGLLDDTRDAGLRYGGFTRSASDRDFRTPGSRGSRERRSPVLGGFPLLDTERDRLAFSGRIQEREFRSSGARSGAASPSNAVNARPLSRNDSWSHSRPAPLLARNMSDLMSNRGSADARDSASGVHPRTGSVYSVGGGGTGGGSTGSGGGRASPTTTSSLFAIQSQIQSLKEKHDTQTEALLAALADSQRMSRGLKEENEALKSQVRSLEERLVEAIANSRQKEKELSRALPTRLAPSPDRTRTVMSHRDMEYSLNSRPPPSTRPSARSTPSPTKRRPSTSSSVFPSIPCSMSLLMAEKPGSPLHGSFGSGSGSRSGSGSGSSPPPSPTLVLPRLASKPKSPVREKFNGDNVTPVLSSQPVTISHKRSTSGASVATSTNFSFETGSPGSLKLKPEHELLLGDMTRLSLVTSFDCDSEVET